MDRGSVYKYGKRIGFTVFTQGILSLAAVIVGFGLPKFLNIEQYARWQIYYFYVAYVNYLQFGFNDGLIVNLSGNQFKELPWGNIIKSTKILVAYILVVSIVIIGGGELLQVQDFSILVLLVFSFVPTILMCILSAVLLAGNKTYEYNLLTLLIRILFFVFVIVGIIFNLKNANFYIISDIISKVIIVVIFWNKERKKINFLETEVKETLQFIIKNCKTGIVIATTVLIIGLLPMCGKVILQIKGNANEYAWFSFAISMLSIILTFTNAIGTVAFPILKNVESSLEQGYKILCEVYNEILGCSLIVWGLITVIIQYVLPEYLSVLEYFPILLAVCWPLGKIQTIIYPYYKIYRKENLFLKISIISIILIFILNIYGYYLDNIRGISFFTFCGVYICFEVLKICLECRILKINIQFKIDEFVRIMLFIIIAMYFRDIMFTIIYLLIESLFIFKFYKKYKTLFSKYTDK